MGNRCFIGEMLLKWCRLRYQFARLALPETANMLNYLPNQAHHAEFLASLKITRHLIQINTICSWPIGLGYWCLSHSDYGLFTSIQHLALENPRDPFRHDTLWAHLCTGGIDLLVYLKQQSLNLKCQITFGVVLISCCETFFVRLWSWLIFSYSPRSRIRPSPHVTLHRAHNPAKHPTRHAGGAIVSSVTHDWIMRNPILKSATSLTWLNGAAVICPKLVLALWYNFCMSHSNIKFSALYDIY